MAEKDGEWQGEGGAGPGGQEEGVCCSVTVAMIPVRKESGRVEALMHCVFFFFLHAFTQNATRPLLAQAEDTAGVRVLGQNRTG